MIIEESDNTTNTSVILSYSHDKGQAATTIVNRSGFVNDKSYLFRKVNIFSNIYKFLFKIFPKASKTDISGKG